MNASKTPLDATSIATTTVAWAPTIDALHRDIAFANNYRLELIKLLMALCAALFAFTVTFRPDLAKVLWPEAMWIGWGGLAVSMVGGVMHLHGWDRFYMTYRDFDHKYRKLPGPIDGARLGNIRRKKINFWRDVGKYCQFAGFVLGVAGVAWFAAVNVDGKHQDTGAPASEARSSTVPAGKGK